MAGGGGGGSGGGADDRKIAIANASTGSKRWLVLLLTSLVVASKNYCFDNPASLQLPLRESLRLTETQYNLLYAVYSFPNVLLPLIGGIAIDGVGNTVSFVGFTLCVVIGQGVFAVGTTLRSFHVALAGRAIFGLGGECLQVVQSTILARWFGVKEMEMAMGIALTTTCLGDVLSDWICPWIYGRDWSPIFPPNEPASPLWLGFVVILLSFWISVAYVAMAIQSDKREMLQIPTILPPLPSLPPSSTTPKGADGLHDHLLRVDVNDSGHGGRVQVCTFSQSSFDVDRLQSSTDGSVSRSKCLLSESLCDKAMMTGMGIRYRDKDRIGIGWMDYDSDGAIRRADRSAQQRHVAARGGCHYCGQQNQSGGVDGGIVSEKGMKTAANGIWRESEEGEINGGGGVVSLGQVSSFGAQFWLLAGSCVVVYAAIVAFHSVASGVLIWKWPSLSLKTAGLLISLPYLVSALVNPPMGWLIRRWGRRVVLSTIAFLLLSLSHVLIAFSSLPPSVPLVVIGCVYAVYAAALWPSVALVIDGSALGTAYGLITSLQNGALVITPIIVGLIKDVTDDYGRVQRFFACVAILGFLMSVILMYVDSKNLDGLLNAAPPPPPNPPHPAAAGTSIPSPSASTRSGIHNTRPADLAAQVTVSDPLIEEKQPLLARDHLSP